MNRRSFLARTAAGLGMFASSEGFAGEAEAFDPASWMIQDNALGASWSQSVEGVAKVRGACGFTRVGTDTPYRVTTIQNIASVSKTVTAAAAMQCVEKGLLALDTDINEYLPFAIRHPKSPEDPITLRMLLSHQSAIRDGAAYQKSYACGDPTLSLENWIRSLFEKGGAHSDETQFHEHAPGEAHRYSNVGFGIVGYLVECVADTPLNLYCRDKIFAPLDMKSTGWMLSEIDVSEHATPHLHLKHMPRRKSGGDRDLITVWPDEAPGFAQYCLYSFPNYPDGLLRTSAVDLEKFLNAFAIGGGALLKPDTVQEMLTPQCDASDEPGHFQALCWVGTKDAAGRTVYSHSGGDPGVSSLAAFRQEDHTAVCALANAETALPFRVVKHLLT